MDTKEMITDIVIGATGLMLANIAMNGYETFDYTKLNYVIIPMILVSKMIVKFGMPMISQTQLNPLYKMILGFGIFGVLLKYVLPFAVENFKLQFNQPTDKEIVVILVSTMIMMFTVEHFMHVF